MSADASADFDSPSLGSTATVCEYMELECPGDKYLLSLWQAEALP